MGKQINFYLSEKSNLLIENYLTETNFCILSLPMPSESLLVIPNLLTENPVRPSYPSNFLY
jgi:hypothetical protein